MSKLKTYSEFINEGMIDAIKNPIKWKKIKNNAKKFQKAKVAQALNDVDFAKRKEKGKDNLEKKQKEVLDQANKAKNSALADTASTISQRMKDIATTPILKKVVSLGTTKSKMAANKIVLKAADGEEAKRLKIAATELSKKASETTGELKDYEKTAGNTDDADTGGDDNKKAIEKLNVEIKTASDAAKAQAKSDNGDVVGNQKLWVKVDELKLQKANLEGDAEAIKDITSKIADRKAKIADRGGDEGGDDGSDEGKPKKKLSAAEQKKADKKVELGKKIGKAMDAIQKAKDQGKRDEAAKEEANKKLDSVMGTEKEGPAQRAVSAFVGAKKARDEGVKKLQSNIKDLQKQQKALDESVEPLVEGMYTASQLTDMLLDDIRKGTRKGIHTPDAKELKALALKRLKMKRVAKVDIEDTINGWDTSLADARKDKRREDMFSMYPSKGKIPESFEYVAESVSEKFARLRKEI